MTREVTPTVPQGPALLTGHGRFVDDVKLPGTLNACFVRSPHAHAKIRSIETATARGMPGVHAVLTADDLPGPLGRERLPMLLPILEPAGDVLRACVEQAPGAQQAPDVLGARIDHDGPRYRRGWARAWSKVRRARAPIARVRGGARGQLPQGEER